MSQPPIRRAVLLAAVSTLCLSAGAARAATVTIDFDDPDRVRNETITDQYGTLGVTFSGDAAKIKTGPGFNNPFDSDGNILHITGSNPQFAVLDFASPTSLLSFEFRRPSDAGQIFVALFDDDGLVFDAVEIGWDPAITPDWVSFEYPGDAGPVTRAEFSAPTKFVIDNLSFEVPDPQPIPLPLPAVLLASGLVSVLGYRRHR
mgnify:CR=1 FL=1